MTGQSTLPTEEFKRDWLSGMKLKDMATKYHHHVSTISQHAQRLGLKARTKRHAHSTGLYGGQWVADARGIKKWVPDE